MSMSISLSDGTVETFTPSSLSESYRGFVSHLAVTSLIWSVPARRFMVGSTT